MIGIALIIAFVILTLIKGFINHYHERRCPRCNGTGLNPDDVTEPCECLNDDNDH